MALEAGTYIDDLVATNPLSTDPRSDGDDHIRLLKAVLKATFPNITGAVTPTQDELNYVDGVTSNIQTQLNALSTGKASMPAGTVCCFYQATAPTGWTQITTQNNKALRVVSGAGGVAGGSVAFTTAFASKAVSGTVGDTALTIAQMPAHMHISGKTGGASVDAGVNPINTGYPTDIASGSAGSGATHTHTFIGTAINLAVQYIDIIIASRN